MTLAPVFEFDFGYLPNSSKNRKRIMPTGKVCPCCKKRTGRPILVTEKKVQQQMADIAERAQAAGIPFFEDDELAVEVRLDIPRKRTVVRIESLGPRPKGVTGRQRDVDNSITTVLDALKGTAYRDDRQVRRERCERFPEGLDTLFGLEGEDF